MSADCGAVAGVTPTEEVVGAVRGLGSAEATVERAAATRHRWLIGTEHHGQEAEIQAPPPQTGKTGLVDIVGRRAAPADSPGRGDRSVGARASGRRLGGAGQA